MNAHTVTLTSSSVGWSYLLELATEQVEVSWIFFHALYLDWSFSFFYKDIL